MSLGTLVASLLGKILACKEINRAGEGFVIPSYRYSMKSKDFQYRFIF